MGDFIRKDYSIVKGPFSSCPHKANCDLTPCLLINVCIKRALSLFKTLLFWFIIKVPEFIFYLQGISFRHKGIYVEFQDSGITANIKALQREWEMMTGDRLPMRQYMAPQKAPATAAAPISMKLNDQI